MIKVPTFKQLARQNTGSHFLDSGDYYGRQYDRPLPKRDSWLEFYQYQDGKFEVSATISLTHFLDSHLTIDKKLTRRLYQLIEDQGGGVGYAQAAELLAEDLGLTYISSDNSYNHETDLDQVFQFSVLSTNESEWYYNEDTILIIETHNGCDVRGGYSNYVVCKPSGSDLCGLFDLCCGVSISEATKDGVKLTYEQCQELDERWQVGYSRRPTSEVNKSIQRVLTRKNKSGRYKKLKVELVDGTIATIYPSPRLGY